MYPSSFLIGLLFCYREAQGIPDGRFKGRHVVEVVDGEVLVRLEPIKNRIEELRKQIEKYKAVMTPAIIQIPGVKGNTGDGIKAVRRSVEQAVGSDILFGE